MLFETSHCQPLGARKAWPLLELIEPYGVFNDERHLGWTIFAVVLSARSFCFLKIGRRIGCRQLEEEGVSA
jgi:hypothetical protein